MISLAAIPTDMLVFFLGSASFTELPGPAIGCHSPHACLSYISSTATVKPLIYGCLSLVTTTTTTTPTLQQMGFGYLLRERKVPNQ